MSVSVGLFCFLVIRFIESLWNIMWVMLWTSRYHIWKNTMYHLPFVDPFNMSPSFFRDKTSLLSGATKCTSFILYPPYPSLWICSFPEEPWSLLVDQDLDVIWSFCFSLSICLALFIPLFIELESHCLYAFHKILSIIPCHECWKHSFKGCIVFSHMNGPAFI